jgi:uncharacterized protein (TIGR02001 family)
MWRCGLAAAAMVMLAAGPAAAQTPDPNAGAITLTSAVDFPSVYFFRGIRQESEPKLTTFATGDVGISLFSGDGNLRSAGLNVGVWNSLHTGTSGSNADKSSHYEEDFYAALALGFGGGFTVTPTFTAYTSPNTSFNTVQELSVKVAHGSRFAPYGLVAYEFKGQADAGVNKATYGEFGVAPSVALGGTPLTLAIPVKVGLSLHDYYEMDGRDNAFGYIDGGLLLTVPFTRLPSQYGSWNVHGGVNVVGFGDTTKAFNNGDSSQVVVSGGIGMSY